MTAPNHALTGAFIGLTVSNPALALSLAFASHFVCDAIPHYDLAEPDIPKRIASKRFLFEFIVLGTTLCFFVVVILVLTRPRHWLQAAAGAFLATSPDLFWIPRFLRARRSGSNGPVHNPFLRFHSWVQWKTAPVFIWVEAAWFLLFGALVYARL